MRIPSCMSGFCLLMMNNEACKVPDLAISAKFNWGFEKSLFDRFFYLSWNCTIPYKLTELAVTLTCEILDAKTTCHSVLSYYCHFSLVLPIPSWPLMFLCLLWETVAVILPVSMSSSTKWLRFLFYIFALSRLSRFTGACTNIWAQANESKLHIAKLNNFLLKV